MPNDYSPYWFTIFLDTYDPARTAAEVAWLREQVPLPAYARVLDVACGPGRHALALAAHGYHVTGVDRDAAVIAAAQRAAPAGTAFRVGDMCDLRGVGGPFDAVLSLWQSFGYFDAATNAAVLGQMVAPLRPGGRLILDLNHRAFFAAHQGERIMQRAGRTIRETGHLVGDRYTVTLDYGPDLPPDRFAWQLYTPAEIVALAAPLGLRPVLLCTEFDSAQPAAPDHARMQVVLER